MFEHVVRVEVGTLGHAFARRQLGKDVVEHVGALQQFQPVVVRVAHAVLFVRVQDERQLGEDALGRNFGNERGVELRAEDARKVGRKPQLRGKARQPHQTQTVLREHLVRVACGGNRPAFDVLHPAERVDDLARADVVIHGVALEIPPQCIRADVRREFDACGRVFAAAVPVGAEGGELHLHLPVRQVHGARVFVCAVHNQPALFGEGGKALGGNGRADVPVLRGGEICERVAHRPAHDVEGELRPLRERIQFFGYGKKHRHR